MPSKLWFFLVIAQLSEATQLTSERRSRFSRLLELAGIIEKAKNKGKEEREKCDTFSGRLEHGGTNLKKAEEIISQKILY